MKSFCLEFQFVIWVLPHVYFISLFFRWHVVLNLVESVTLANSTYLDKTEQPFFFLVSIFKLLMLVVINYWFYSVPGFLVAFSFYFLPCLHLRSFSSSPFFLPFSSSVFPARSRQLCPACRGSLLQKPSRLIALGSLCKINDSLVSSHCSSFLQVSLGCRFWISGSNVSRSERREKPYTRGQTTCSRVVSLSVFLCVWGISHIVSSHEVTVNVKFTFHLPPFCFSLQHMEYFVMHY